MTNSSPTQATATAADYRRTLQTLADGDACDAIITVFVPALVTTAGYDEIAHYYRPSGMPREEQPWLATVWRKATAP